MTAIHFSPAFNEVARRQAIYAGAILTYGPSPESLALCAFGRGLIEEAFTPHPPETAQFFLPVEAYAAILADVKPRFIHHPESKRLIRALLRSLGCDEDETYFDVPRLRSATSDDFLTTGIAYAFHPHRDTWYSAPMCQINFWMPVYPVQPDNIMAFHPQYWAKPLANSSQGYDYQQWNAASRFNAAQQIGRDTRVQPTALEPVVREPDLRLVTPVGGIQMFSAAQLHSTVPNRSGRTRFSIDFRIVHAGDARAELGAANVDSYCTGTTMPDYLRLRDLAHVDDAIVDQYMKGHPQHAPRMRRVPDGA